jgi:hypothetical protein
MVLGTSVTQSQPKTKFTALILELVIYRDIVKLSPDYILLIELIVNDFFRGFAVVHYDITMFVWLIFQSGKLIFPVFKAIILKGRRLVSSISFELAIHPIYEIFFSKM